MTGAIGEPFSYAATWRGQATRQSGSWWEDWSQWGAERAGPLGPVPGLGSKRYPALGEAPGDYIRG